MTPEEAVAELANKCFIFKPLPQILTIVEAVQATEMRRCAALVEETMRMWSHHGTFGGVLHSLILNILRTGGLEAGK